MVFSLKVAFVVTLIATVLGTLMGVAHGEVPLQGQGQWSAAILVLPLTMPEVVLGFSLLTLFVTANWARGFVTIVIAQVMFSVSYVATTVRARTRGFDWRLEEASLDLGATPWRTYTRITLPLIAPGVVAAALLTFALSLDDFIITYLNSGLENTFPIQVWNTQAHPASRRRSTCSRPRLLRGQHRDRRAGRVVQRPAGEEAGRRGGLHRRRRRLIVGATPAPAPSGGIRCQLTRLGDFRWHICAFHDGFTCTGAVSASTLDRTPAAVAPARPTIVGAHR